MATTPVGRKRKRDGVMEEEVNARIGGKIHHEKKLVHKASKKAKVFEIQKVVQRLKNERKKNSAETIISEYEAQLSTLKAVNDDVIGNSAFRSKILKDHILRTNDTVLSFVKQLESNLPGSVEPGLAKIQSRLLSSKVLSAQVAASVESLRILVNPALRHHSFGGDDDALRATQKSKGQISSHQSRLLDEDKEPSAQIAGESGWESGTVDMADDASWESDSDYGSNRCPGGLDQGSRLEAESDEDSDGSDHESMGPVVSNGGGYDGLNKDKKANSSITESTFLPSLSVGFVKGSDDSDFDEAAEIKAADLPRKNRRGQRARRAIWEKKYGRHANHKKKEAEDRATAFAKKASTAQTPTKFYDAQRRGMSGRGAGIEPDNPPRSKDDNTLHPSWEAKRKQKDKDKGNIVPSQGKKIKF